MVAVIMLMEIFECRDNEMYAVQLHIMLQCHNHSPDSSSLIPVRCCRVIIKYQLELNFFLCLLSFLPFPMPV